MYGMYGYDGYDGYDGCSLMASSPDVSEEWSDSSVLHAVKAETDKRLVLLTHETRSR